MNSDDKEEFKVFLFSDKEVREAIEAWENSKASDEQLKIAIEATEIALHVLRAHGAGGIMTVGLQLNLSSMISAQVFRQRDKS